MVVVDEEPIAAQLEALLTKMGYAVATVVSDAGDPIVVAREVRPDLALVDLAIRQGVTGPEVGDQLAARLTYRSFT